MRFRVVSTQVHGQLPTKIAAFASQAEAEAWSLATTLALASSGQAEWLKLALGERQTAVLPVLRREDGSIDAGNGGIGAYCGGSGCQKHCRRRYTDLMQCT